MIENNKNLNNIATQKENNISLFNTKCKKVQKKSLTYIESDTGKTRHFTPASQEWYNSIYTYNNNYIKSLSVADKNLISLLKSYFNSELKKEFLKTKVKTLTKRFKRLSTKRTFVGKGFLKHTNNKVIITFFVYNTEGMFLSSFFKSMIIKLIQPNESKEMLKYNTIWQGSDNITKVYNRWFTSNEYLNVSEHKELYYSYITTLINELNHKLDIINKSLVNSKIIVSNKLLTSIDKLVLFNKNMNNILQNKDFDYISFYNYKLEAWKDYMSGYNKYKLLWKLNKVKFNDNFLMKIVYLAKKIYNKKIEFNIINLKKLHLNSDIFTQAVSLKLKNKDNKLYKVLKASLRKIKLPTISKIKEKEPRASKNEFLINNIRNVTIKNMFKDNKNNDPLTSLLLNFYPLADNIKVDSNNRLTNDFIEIKDNKEMRLISLISYVQKFLKHTDLRGIRVEAKGRLTRRATASRSVFKMKWKGGLKNVDSSFKGLSTIMLRGFSKSNVQYSLKNSKNRNGAFGIKTWVSSK